MCWRASEALALWTTEVPPRGPHLALEKLGRHVQRRADLAHRRRARAEFGLAKVGQLRRRLLDGHARGRDEQRVLRLDVAICGEGG